MADANSIQLPPGTKDEVGNVYGNLTVLEYVWNDKPGAYWKCRCTCGNICIVFGGNLRAKNYTKRTCIKCRNIRHGKTGTPEHYVWRSMKQRCQNPNNHDYHLYGGRGIRVCERWQTFENFLADMGPKPFPKATVERRNGDGDYEPSNCEWATQAQQTLNTSRSVLLTHNGKTQNFMLWCRELGIHPATLENRLHRSGWSVEKALTTPVRKRKSGLNPRTSSIS